jgi:hypothetical protein
VSGAGAAYDAGDPSEPHGAAGAQAPPTEDELRRAYEEELSRITTTDMMAQAVISLLNLGARRLGLSDSSRSAQADAEAQGRGGAAASAGGTEAASERDLEQARDAIDGVRALMGILERRISRELGPLRDALSQLQMAYAREVEAEPGARSPTGSPGGGAGGTGTGGAGAGGAGAGGTGTGGAGRPGGGSAGEGGAPAGEQPAAPGRRPGPAESSGRLWVPGR